MDATSKPIGECSSWVLNNFDGLSSQEQLKKELQ
jgi:hypothetical protein